MDWLTFKFCVIIWGLCVSKSQSQLTNSTTLTISDEMRIACEEGQPVASPDECNTCICFAGQVHCTHLPCPEQDCVDDVELPQPDPCNKCVCRKGKVRCSDRICIPAPNCAENQLYPAQNECNACICTDGYIACTNNSCPSNNTSIAQRNHRKKKCVEGSPLPGPNECIECHCKNGRKRCKYICHDKPIVKSRFQESECTPGQHIPSPDECNNCICFDGQIHCTHMPCQLDVRMGSACTEDQPVIRPDECNECYCFEGQLECSNLICIRGSTCVEGQEIPKPDTCNSCKCIEGRILCTNHHCLVPLSRNTLGTASSTEMKLQRECQVGDVLPSPPPPDDCNTCFCMDHRILCTMNNCVDSSPEILTRIREPNEENNLEMYDRQILMEPFINMLSKNYDKPSTQLIHTHAYNGFHQEIKVHSSNLHKDATKLLKVLATSLDNSALASISQKLLSDSHPNDQNSHKLLNRLDETNDLSKETVLTQSSKLITSGSRSNETILVVPNTEPFDYQNSQSMPLTSKQETSWKSVSSSAPLVSTHTQQVKPLSNQLEKNYVYYNDNAPPKITPIDQRDVIGKSSKLGPWGLPHLISKNPMHDIVEIPNIKTQSLYTTLKPMSINNNDGKITYALFPQENRPFKQFPSPREEVSHLRPYQHTKPGHNIFNYTSLHPKFETSNLIKNAINNPNNNGGLQQPSQSQFVPNPSKYYPNHINPQQYQHKSNQNHLPTLSNNGILHPPLFHNNPNQPIVSANRYKPSPFGLKPGQGSMGPLNNKGNQTDQQLKLFPHNFQVNPPLINLPAQNKHISYRGHGGSEEIPSFPNFELNSTNILIPPQNGVNLGNTQHKSPHSQFVPNPSIYYKYEYESPKIDEVNLDEEQLQPHSKITHTEFYNPLETFSKSDHKTLPGRHNETKVYNSQSQFEFPQDQYNNEGFNGHKSPEDSQSPFNLAKDLMHPARNKHLPLQTIISEPIQNQHIPGVPDAREPTNEFQYANNIYEDPRQLKPIYNFPPSEIETLQKNHLQGAFNEPGATDIVQYPSYSAEDLLHPQLDQHTTNFDPTHPKDSLNDPQFVLAQNQPKSGVFHSHEVNDRYQYGHNANEIPTQLKPVHKLPEPSYSPTAIQHTPGVIVKSGSTDGFQHPPNPTANLVSSTDNLHNPPYTKLGPTHIPNFAEDPTHSREELHNSPFAPTQNQHLPAILDDLESPNGVRYPAHFVEAHSKPIQHISPHLGLTQNQNSPPYSPFNSNQSQHLPGVFGDRESTDGFRYPSHSAETTSKPFRQFYPLSQLGSTQNQNSPEDFEDHKTTDGFKNIPNFAESPSESIGKSPYSPFGPTQNQHLPGLFEDRGFTDGFTYPSHSAEDPTHSNGKPSYSPFGSTQNQHLPGVFDDRGSSDGFTYQSHSAADPTHSNGQPSYSSFGPTQNQHLPGVFDDRGSSDGFTYPSHSAEHPTHFNGKPSYSPFGPTQNQHLPGVFDDRGSSDGFTYPSHSAEDPTHSNSKPSYSPFGPTQNQHLPGVFDDRGSSDGFTYPSHSAEDPTHSNGKPSYSPFGPTQNQHLPGVFDDRGSSDGFTYPSHSAEDPTHSNGKPSYSPFGPTQNQHLPGVFDDRGSSDGYIYPSHSAEDSTHSNGKPSYFPFGPTQNQHLPGVFDDRGSSDGFAYPSHSAEDPTHSNGKPSYSPFGPTQNQHLPGVFDDRGSSDGYIYPSHSAEDPTHSNGKPSYSPFGPTHNQHLPGVFDDRGSSDGFTYPSHSAEDLTHSNGKPSYSPFGPTQNQHLPGVFDDRGSPNGFTYPSHSAEDPTHSNGKPSYSPFGPTQNQHLPGVFDDRGSSDGYTYPSHSAETHPKPLQHSPLLSQLGPTQIKSLPRVIDDRESADGLKTISHSAEDPTYSNGKPSYSPFGPTQNQHLPGVFDDRSSTDGFTYPSHSAETNPKPLQHSPLLSQLGPTQIKNLPRDIDDRESADGLKTISHSVEDPTHSNGKPSYSPFGPTQNQHLPGVLDDHGSFDGFTYPSHSAADPTHSNGKPSYSPFGPTQNQHLPGVFDDRGSSDGFTYQSHSAADPTHSNGQPSYSSFGPTQNQHLPGVFDDRSSIDGFTYPSHSAESHPKPLQHSPLLSQLDPTQIKKLPRVIDDRESADGLKTISHSAEDPTYSNGKPSYSPFGPTQNQHLPGVFDDRGSSDGFTYPSHSAEDPTHSNGKPSYSPFVPTQNQHLLGVFDDRGSTDGFTYPSHPVETHLEPLQHSLPVSQLDPTQINNLPRVIDDRESADKLKTISNSAENPTHWKGKLPNPPIGPTQNQHLPGVFDDRGSSDGFTYPSHSAETHPKPVQYTPLLSQLVPTQIKNLPQVFDDRESDDGFKTISNSAASTEKNTYTSPDSRYEGIKNQPKPLSLVDDKVSKEIENQPEQKSILDLNISTDTNYNNNNDNPLGLWKYRDRDQYKPSSFDSLLNEVHNVRFSLPDDNKKVSNSVSSAPEFSIQPDHDKLKPSFFANFFKGVRKIPWSVVPNLVSNALDLYKPSMNLTASSDLDSDSTQIPDNPHFSIKSIGVPNNSNPTDDGENPGYYDKLLRLLMTVKKLSESPLTNNSELGIDQLDFLRILLPDIATTLNHEPSSNQNASSLENYEIQKILPLIKEHLPDIANGALDWVKSKLKKYVPTLYNTTVNNDIDKTKIFNLLSKLAPKIKHTVAKNMPFSDFNPEIIENIMNDLKKSIITTTQSPSTDSTQSFENRFRDVSAETKDNQQQAPQIKYPDVHIILHQPDGEDDEDIAPYSKTDVLITDKHVGDLSSNMGSEESGASLFQNTFNPRFRHRPKDRKDECGDGSQWISNCHGCSCYFGQAMCFRMPDCNLRRFGEPMTCKPYSHFKMGNCYTCECNGDGVAECDAVDCNTEPLGKSKDSTELPLPVFKEFFDDKKANEIMQYYSFYKKLPKDCPKQNLQTLFPTCERGTSWVSSCHRCECNENGKHECVKIDGCKLDYDSYGKPSRCKPNSKFYPKTNNLPCVECTCNDEGQPYCPGVEFKKH